MDDLLPLPLECRIEVLCHHTWFVCLPYRFSKLSFLNLFISQARELFLKAVEEEQNGALYEGKTQLLNCSSLAISIHLCWNLFGIEHSPPTAEVISLN